MMSYFHMMIRPSMYVSCVTCILSGRRYNTTSITAEITTRFSSSMKTGSRPTHCEYRTGVMSAVYDCIVLQMCFCVVFSRQQSRAAMTKSSANGQTQYNTPGLIASDSCRNHDDEYQLKCGEQVSLSAGLRPRVEYHSNTQRRPMDVQHCDHVTLPHCAAANGCAALTEVTRNSYG